MLKREEEQATIKVPEFEEIVTQIKENVPKITEAETEEIAKFVKQLLKEVINVPETKDGFKHKKAKVTIASWNNVKVMADVMRYPEAYSKIDIKPSERIAGIEFFPVLVYSTKEVYLHYIY